MRLGRCTYPIWSLEQNVKIYQKWSYENLHSNTKLSLWLLYWKSDRNEYHPCRDVSWIRPCQPGVQYVRLNGLAVEFQGLNSRQPQNNWNARKSNSESWHGRTWKILAQKVVVVYLFEFRSTTVLHTLFIYEDVWGFLNICGLYFVWKVSLYWRPTTLKTVWNDSLSHHSPKTSTVANYRNL